MRLDRTETDIGDCPGVGTLFGRGRAPDHARTESRLACLNGQPPHLSKRQRSFQFLLPTVQARVQMSYIVTGSPLPPATQSSPRSGFPGGTALPNAVRILPATPYRGHGTCRPAARNQSTRASFRVSLHDGGHAGADIRREPTCARPTSVICGALGATCGHLAASAWVCCAPAAFAS